MKIIKKGVEILYYKNGDKRYIAFVVCKGKLFNNIWYVCSGSDYHYKNGDWLKLKDNICYNKYLFPTEEEAIEYLNKGINLYVKKFDENEGWKLIKKEVKYINE
jgi:hypothetical protein